MVGASTAIPAAPPSGPPQGAPTEPDAEDEVVPAEPADPRLRRRRRRLYATAIVAGIISSIIVTAGLVKIPYYTFSPGSVRSTEPLVRVDGAPTFRDGEDISFTTVSLAEATALTAALGWLDPATEVLPAQDALGGQAPEENRRRNLEMMDNSKQTAQVVALRRLGYDVTATGTGAVIAFIKPDSPVDEVLDVDDVVIGVDGKDVGIADDLVSAIGAKKPGDTIRLKVERSTAAPAGDPHGGGSGEEDRTDDPAGGDGDDHDGPKPEGPEIVEVETVVVAREDDPSAPMLGIQAGTRGIHFELPFDVSIDSGEVGGPSAGLAFTLGIIDVLTPGSLTGGKRIATTGTIDLRGNVGPVGGVPQKTVAARRAGMEAFLVPPDEYQQALQFAGDMKIMEISTLDDALEAIAEVGHDPSADALVASAPKPAS